MDESRPLRSTRRLSNRAWDRPAWYTITNSASGTPAQVAIYDEIGFYGVSAGQFMADLDGITGDIEMHINSPGGDIYDGITIYNRLKQRKGSIHVIVDGLAASAASFIAMAASPGRLEMAPRSEMMIHNGFTMAIGDAADLRKTADLLDKKTADIADMYAERSGKPAAYWLGKMQAETWFSAEETVAEGLADSIHGQAPAANQWDLSVYAKASRAPEPAPAQDTEPAPVQASDVSPPAGTVPPATVPAPAPTFPVLAAEIDSSPWNAAQAWAAGAASDDPASFYAGICAGRQAGDPATPEAWALPYKYSPASPPNASGVRDALSRLPLAKSLTNGTQARVALEKAMKQINPDYDPDDYIDHELLAAVLGNSLEGANK